MPFNCLLLLLLPQQTKSPMLAKHPAQYLSWNQEDQVIRATRKVERRIRYIEVSYEKYSDKKCQYI